MTDPMQNLQLTLTVTEVNQILEALGQRTYADVYRLVSKIRQQADGQLSESEDLPDKNHADPENELSDADKP